MGIRIWMKWKCNYKYNCKVLGEGYEVRSWRYYKIEEITSVWQQRMGSATSGSRFSIEMYGMWSSNYGTSKDCGEKHKKY